MNKLLSTTAKATCFAAALLFFMGSVIPQASAQRHFGSKLGPESTIPPDDGGGGGEDPPPPPPPGNKKYYFFEDLKDSSALVMTKKSESGKTLAPTVTGLSKGKKKWRDGRSKSSAGTVVFDGSQDNRRSCAWIPKSGDPATFPLQDKIIRGYYTIKFDSDDHNERGEGTVLAFLPGSTDVTPGLCGSYGSDLGYANNGSYNSMPEPRFGIEIDVTRNSSMNDPDNNHLAIVYNGVKHDGTLAPSCPATSSANDNTSPYGACWVGAKEQYDWRGWGWGRGRRAWSDGIVLASASFSDLPLPQSAPEDDGSYKLADRDEDRGRGGDNWNWGGGGEHDWGKGWRRDNDRDDDDDRDRDRYRDNDRESNKKANWLEDGKEHGIRVEITSGHASCAATQIHVKAWACKSDDNTCSKDSNFKVVAAAYTGRATGVVEACVPFNPATYANLVIGFTYASSKQKTKVTYNNFVIQTFNK
ncbi:MAG: hypothetical protein HZA67_07540 [Rhodospirillales bacterium]|nr:hypothetical protein [Rhodospirillales bacterium]